MYPPPSVDACASGELLTALEVERSAGAPNEEITSFVAPTDGFLCVGIDNDGAAAGWVCIDDTCFAGPDAFTPLTTHIERTLPVDDGPHELRATIASMPGSSFKVSVLFTAQPPGPIDPATGPRGLVTVSNVRDAPDPFSPGVPDGIDDVTEITALASVRRVGGLAGPDPDPPATFSVTFRVSIVDGVTCTLIRSLEGSAPVDPGMGGTGAESIDVPLQVVWDGRDEGSVPVKAGTYFYRLEALFTRVSTSGEENLLDAVLTRFRTITVRQSTPTLLSPTGESMVSVEIGNGVVARIDELAPRTSYGIRVVSDGDLRATVTEWRLTTDGSGSIPPVTYWPGTGVVGCGAGGFDDPVRNGEPFVFRDAASAVAGLSGARFCLDVSKDGVQLSCEEIELLAPASPRIFPSDADGCLLRAPRARTDDLYVTGENLPPGSAVQVYLSESRSFWPLGEPLEDVRGAPTEIVLGPGETEFTELLLTGTDLPADAYSVLGELGTFLSPPAFPGVVTTTTMFAGLIAQVPTTDITLGGRIFALTQELSATGFVLVLPPFFSISTTHRNLFRPGFDVFLRMLPRFRPEIVGMIADVYVIEARPSSDYLSPFFLDDVDGPGGVETVTFGGAVDLQEALIWPGATPEGKYDIVVDTNRNGSFTPGADLRDAFYREPGLTVRADPGQDGQHLAGITTYSSPTPFVPPLFPDLTVAIEGIVAYPAAAPGGAGAPYSTDPSVQVAPLVIVVHGQHDPDGNDFGFANLILRLATHGYVAVAMNLDSWTEAEAALPMLPPDALLVNRRTIGSKADMIGETLRYFIEEVNTGTSELAGHIRGHTVGLIGHSQGGEAAAVAANRFVAVEAVITIAPSKLLDWFELVPAPTWCVADVDCGPAEFCDTAAERCTGILERGITDPLLHIVGTHDCDVGYPLALHVKVAARGPKFHVTAPNLGHNLFNESWDPIDELQTDPCGAPGFPATPPPEFNDVDNYRDVLWPHAVAFLDRYLRGGPGLEDIFEGSLGLPSVGIPVERESRRAWGFDRLVVTSFAVPGDVTNLLEVTGLGLPSFSGTVTGVTETTDGPRGVAEIEWSDVPGPVGIVTFGFDETDVLGFRFLSFAGAQRPPIDTVPILNPLGARKVFSVRVLDALGEGSIAVPIEQFRTLPSIGDTIVTSIPLFATVRIPLEAFLLLNPALELTRIIAVELVFDGMDGFLTHGSTGMIFLDDVEFTR